MRQRIQTSPVRRLRRAAGFTLTELMTVVVIVGVVAAVAARYSGRTSTGEQTSEVARAVINSVNEARQSALTMGQTTRLRVDATNKKIFNERQDPVTAGSWIALGAAVQIPSGVDLCDVKNSPLLTASTSTCPTATNTRICFGPTGRVDVPTTVTSDTCTSTSSGTGATLFLQSHGDYSSPKQFKLVLFKLTGMSRMTDKW